MSRLTIAAVAVCTLTLVACGDAETPRSLPDAGVPVDAGPDACENETVCSSESACIEIGDDCLPIDGDGTPIFDTLAGRYSGRVTGLDIGGLVGSHPVEYFVVDSDETLTGLMRIDGPDRDVYHRFWGALDRERGRLSLRLSAPSCVSGDTDCDDVPPAAWEIPIYDVTGRVASDSEFRTSLLIGSPTVRDDLPSFDGWTPGSLFVDAYAQPNDGVKPATIEARDRVVGEIVTMPGLAGDLPTRDTCTMSWATAGDDFTLRSFGCVELDNTTAFEALTETFEFDPESGRFWFRISDGSATYLFVGENGTSGLDGVVADEKRSIYWIDQGVPVAIGEIADRDIVGFFELEPVDENL